MKNIKFLNNCLLIKDILVIGDLHLGYGGFGIINDVMEKLEVVFLNLMRKGIKVKKVILLGDVKHDFQSINNNEWRDVLQLLDYLIKKVGRNNIIVIKGNHDNIIGSILRKRDIKLRDCYKIKIKETCRNIWFLHGNKVFGQVFKQGLDRQVKGGSKQIVQQMRESKQTIRQMFRQTDKHKYKKDILILGHLHPAITLKDKYKKEKYKCFLYGNWKGFNVYILPSFSFVSIGYDLRELENNKKEKGLIKRRLMGKRKRREGNEFFIIPDKDLMRFEVVVYNEKEDKEYKFGKLRGLI